MHLSIQALRQLVRVVSDLSLARKIEDITTLVRTAARRLVEADGATFVLKEGEQSYYADEDALGPLFKGKRFPIESCIGGTCMLESAQLVVEDVSTDPRIPPGVYETTFVKSLVMTPIRGADPIGAIGVYWARPYRPNEDELELLQALADTTSVAFENVRIYQGLEQRVRERTAELEAAYKELESFSYSVSHDLRAPLRAIAGFSARLLERADELPDEQVRQDLSRINNAAGRMNELIDALLGLAQTTQQPMRLETVDLSALAEEIGATLRERHPQQAVEFSVTPGAKAYGDRRLLTVLLENLLGNAWKYSAKRNPARIAFDVKQSGAETVYCVCDNGVGFDTRYADRLFEPFQRLHSPTEFPGSGIGLATAHRVIAKHGGRIWAHAEPDVGATFYFTLPPKPATA